MRADHHDLVLLLPAGKVGDDVYTVHRVAVELSLHIQFQADGNVLPEQPRDAVVVLGGQCDAGGRQRFLSFARSGRSGENRAVIAGKPRRNDRQHSLFLQKLVHLGPELAGLLQIAGPGAAGAPRAESLIAGLRGQRRLRQVGVGVTLGVGLQVQRQLARGVQQHELALQLAFGLLEVLGGAQGRQDGLTSHRALGPGRPGQRNADQRGLLRLEHVNGEPAVGPGAPEGPPFLELGVFQSPALQGLHGPFGGLQVLRRIRQPGSIKVGEGERVVHDLGILKRLGLDPVYDRQIHLLLGLERDGQTQGDKQQQGFGFHGVKPKE